MIDRYKPLIYNYKLGVFSLLSVMQIRKNIAGISFWLPVIQFVDAHRDVQNGG